ncbi:MAG: carboxy terminal-processing peptidase [Verrucomicrobiota bacterium]
MMIRSLGTLRRLGVVAALALSIATGFAASGDRKAFSTSTALAGEAQLFLKLLEQAHYNRDNVRTADYAQVIPDYMGDLDGQRLFFLASDRAKFDEEHGKNVYYNTAFIGNVNAAYEIFYVFQTRLENRVSWIFEELKKDWDLSVAETYAPNRSKAEWPKDAAEADDLWRRRVKYELVGELLNKKTIDQARETVRKRYERLLKTYSEMEGNDLAELYLSTIARLYDPHSSYLSASTYEDFGIQMKLELFGIGALLGLEEDNCVVREIVAGGPADVGRELKPNDKIISVAQGDGEPVEILGMKLRKIVEMIRGQKGSRVRLLVQPADAMDTSVRREIVIVRDKVKLNNARARGAIFQIPGEDGKNQPVGVIALPAFYGPGDEGDTDSEKSTATMDVARLITQLKKENIQGLVLDLRRNGGGFLLEAINLAGLFIDKGPVVQVKNYAGEVQVDSDNDPAIAYSGPLAVLVDRFSASASEIVTGALQNYGRAIVIGDSSTHGKGTVQQVIEMKQRSRLLAVSPQKTGAAKFTIQKYYLPSGASTQLKGVVPDIVLPSVEDYLPIGEGDLPRALVWDQIQKPAVFKGEPLDPKVLAPLRESSLERQKSLEEFTYLRRYVERFKARQEEKNISVNLETRKQQKTDDDAFRKEIKAEKERLSKNDFAYKPFYLGPPPTPKIKAPKKEGEDDDELDFEENDTWVKTDVHLREALRVVNDAINLGRSPERWANKAPLTAGIN